MRKTNGQRHGREQACDEILAMSLKINCLLFASTTSSTMQNGIHQIFDTENQYQKNQGTSSQTPILGH